MEMEVFHDVSCLVYGTKPRILLCLWKGNGVQNVLFQKDQHNHPIAPPLMGITSSTPQDLSGFLSPLFLDQASNRHDLTPLEVAAAILCAKPEPGHRFNEVQESYLKIK